MLKVIVPSFTCEKWIDKCLTSIENQNYVNWEGVVINDASTDSTGELASKHTRFKHINNPKNIGAMINHVKGVDLLKPDNEDVILVVDGDDWLNHNYVFNIVADAYKDINIWMTYGNYIEYPKNIIKKTCVPLTRNYNFRTGRWIMSQLRTYKFFLYKNLKASDVCFTGTDIPYPTTYDQALMRPMGEMAGKEHIKFINETLLVYNTDNPLMDRKVNKSIEPKCLADIMAKKPYSLKTKEELCR